MCCTGFQNLLIPERLYPFISISPSSVTPQPLVTTIYMSKT